MEAADTRVRGGEGLPATHRCSVEPVAIRRPSVLSAADRTLPPCLMGLAASVFELAEFQMRLVWSRLAETNLMAAASSMMASQATTSRSIVRSTEMSARAAGRDRRQSFSLKVRADFPFGILNLNGQFSKLRYETGSN